MLISKVFRTLFAILFAFSTKSYSNQLNCDLVYDAVSMSKDTIFNKKVDSTQLALGFLDFFDPQKVLLFESRKTARLTKLLTAIDSLLSNKDCTSLMEEVNLFLGKQIEVEKIIDNYRDSNAQSRNLNRYSNTVVPTKEDYWPRNYTEMVQRIESQLALQTAQESAKASPRLIAFRTKVKLGIKPKVLESEKKVINSGRISQEFLKEKYVIAANAILKGLDPHAGLYPGITREQLTDMNRVYSSLGAKVRVIWGKAYFESVIPDSPSSVGGIENGDILLRIGSKKRPFVLNPVDELTETQINFLLTGDEGEKIGLEVLKSTPEGNHKLKVTLAYQTIEDENKFIQIKRVGVGKTRDRTKEKVYVAILRIPDFSVAGFFNGIKFKVALMNQLNKLKKVEALIIDLRFNGGGKGSGARSLLASFIGGLNGTGDYLTTLSSDGKMEVQTVKTPIYSQIPIVLLINRRSASSSEIVSVALKEMGRAIVVGDPGTFGKGVGQNYRYHPITGDLIKYTASQIFGPSGLPLQENGVCSDIVIPSITAAQNIGMRNYSFRIPRFEVKKRNNSNRGENIFSQRYRDPLILNKLIELSQNRVAKSQAFQDLINDRYVYKNTLGGTETNDIDRHKLARKKAIEYQYLGFGNLPALSLDWKVVSSKDIVLRETVFIASDYALLMRGK